MNAKNYSELDPELDIPPFAKYMNNCISGSIFLTETAPDEIVKLTCELENKASDLNIPVIKKCIPLLAPILSAFFNNFMLKGIFPNILKIGSISPIFKHGGPQRFGNYRPVSTLPLLGKLFEKVIYSRLYDYLASKNVLYSKQFGFRKNQSTSHAVNYSINKY